MSREASAGSLETWEEQVEYGLGDLHPGRAANKIVGLAHKSYYLKRVLVLSRLTCNSLTNFGVLTVHDFADETGIELGAAQTWSQPCHVPTRHMQLDAETLAGNLARESLSADRRYSFWEVCRI